MAALCAFRLGVEPAHHLVPLRDLALSVGASSNSRVPCPSGWSKTYCRGTWGQQAFTRRLSISEFAGSRLKPQLSVTRVVVTILALGACCPLSTCF